MFYFWLVTAISEEEPYNSPYDSDGYMHKKHHSRGKHGHRRRHYNNYGGDYGYGYPYDSEDEMYGEIQYYYGLDEKGNPTCGKNAALINKKCQCNKGFPYGNPAEEKGCWACSEKCSQYGKCEYPGKCECFYGYEGNGTFCYAEKPSVRAISEVADGKINVSISYDADIRIHEGYCKFGDISVVASEATNEYFICAVPEQLDDQVSFKISLDGEKWTEDSLVYEKKTTEKEPGQHLGNTTLVIIFIVSMILLVLLLSQTKPVEREETKPFIVEKPRNKNGVVHRRLP